MTLKNIDLINFLAFSFLKTVMQVIYFFLKTNGQGMFKCPSLTIHEKF